MAGTVDASPSAPHSQLHRDVGPAPEPKPAGSRPTPWYFRFRSHLIVALVGVLIVWPSPWRLALGPAAIAAGIALIALGVGLRLWSVRQIGGAAHRTKVAKATQLVTWGPFSWSRNPIYIGNMLLFAGFAVLAGVGYWLVLLVGLLWLQYSLTVRFEESFLEANFGDEFRAYCRRTPRWLGLPRSGLRPQGFEAYPLRKLLRRERSLLLFQLPLGVALVLLRFLNWM
jgi:protein-S-isoprenylcysteine O-methyltransferase Ste14